MSNADYFAGAAGEGPAFGALTGGVFMVFMKKTAGNLTREVRVQRFTPATRGWRVMPYDGTQARVQTTMVSAAPANVSEVNTVATLAPDVWHRFAGINNNGVLECYLDNVLLSAGTALPSYTAPTTEVLQLLMGSSTLVDELAVESVALVDGACNGALVTSWDAQVIGGGSRAPTGAARLWMASDAIIGTSWTDRVASQATTKQGVSNTTYLTTYTNPVYAT
jgi:hypothetical protein